METFSALLAICAGNSPVPVNSPHKGQCRGALMFTLICARINGWVNNREAGDLRRYRAHCDVIVMNTTDFSKIMQIETTLFVLGVVCDQGHCFLANVNIFIWFWTWFYFPLLIRSSDSVEIECSIKKSTYIILFLIYRDNVLHKYQMIPWW